jgi:hypothetical protein
MSGMLKVYGRSCFSLSATDAFPRRPDIATIRTKHRLCGVFTGTLPHLSQQNIFLGVPMVLLPEEVVLLVGNGMLWSFYSD